MGVPHQATHSLTGSLGEYCHLVFQFQVELYQYVDSSKHNIFHRSNKQLTNNWWLLDTEIEFNEASHSVFADQTIY